MFREAVISASCYKKKKKMLWSEIQNLLGEKIFPLHFHTHFPGEQEAPNSSVANYLIS